MYTSSAAACMPSPFTALYSATKSFISAFAAGLAAEVKSKGVDVCVVHPSPVATRFYDKAHKMDMLDFFKNFSVDPDTLPEKIFKAIGRTVWTDIGATAIGFRMVCSDPSLPLSLSLFSLVKGVKPTWTGSFFVLNSLFFSSSFLCTDDENHGLQFSGYVTLEHRSFDAGLQEA